MTPLYEAFDKLDSILQMASGTNNSVGADHADLSCLLRNDGKSHARHGSTTPSLGRFTIKAKASAKLIKRNCMIKLIAIGLLILTTAVTNASELNQSLQIDIADAAQAFLSFNYERMINESNSVSFDISYRDFNYPEDNYRNRSFHLYAAKRIHREPALSSRYIEYYASYQYDRDNFIEDLGVVDSTEYDLTVNTIEAGAAIGKKWIFFSHFAFSLEASIGIPIPIITYNKGYQQSTVDIRPILIYRYVIGKLIGLDFSIGYAF